MKEIIELFFYSWLEKEHPAFVRTFNVFAVVFIAGILSSIVLWIMDFSWWWKLCVGSVSFFIIIKIVYNVMLRNYSIDFLSRK